MIGKLGTVCMTGTFNKEKQTFTAYPDTKMGTVQRKSMLQLCNIDDPDLLTQEIVIQNIEKLRNKLFPKVKQNLTALSVLIMILLTIQKLLNKLNRC